MNIQEATKKAVECGGYIVPKKWAGRIKIRPTNSSNCCLVYSKNHAPCPRWEPDAEDLMADDWTVTTTEGWPEDVPGD